MASCLLGLSSLRFSSFAPWGLLSFVPSGPSSFVPSSFVPPFVFGLRPFHPSRIGPPHPDLAQPLRRHQRGILAEHHRVGAGAGAEDADLALHAEGRGAAA